MVLYIQTTRMKLTICLKKVIYSLIEQIAELVGKTAVFDGLRDAIFAGYLVRFSPLAMCSSEYFNFIMNSTLHREWCNQNKTDAIGQSNINATKLRDFLFPLAPLAEQQAIVDHIENPPWLMN